MQEGSVWLLAQDEPVPIELMFGLLHVLVDANLKFQMQGTLFGYMHGPV